MLAGYIEGQPAANQRHESEMLQMSERMEQAIKRSELLPAQDQESFAVIIFQEIESVNRWDALLNRTESARVFQRIAVLAKARASRAWLLDFNELSDHSEPEYDRRSLRGVVRGNHAARYPSPRSSSPVRARVP